MFRTQFDNSQLDILITTSAFLTGTLINVLMQFYDNNNCKTKDSPPLCMTMGFWLTTNTLFWFLLMCVATHQRLRNNQCPKIINCATNILLHTSTFGTLLNINLFTIVKSLEIFPTTGAIVLSVMIGLFTIAFYVLYICALVNQHRKIENTEG